MLAADGRASSSSNLACCFCAVWAPWRAEGSGGAMFGHTGLCMLICRNECVASHGPMYPPDAPALYSKRLNHS